MILWFWIIAAALVAAVLVVLLWPLLRQADGEEAEEESVAAVFRRQLAELEADRAQGRLAADEAEAIRTEITRRMLAEAERRRQAAAAPASRRGERIRRLVTAAGLAFLLPAAALAVYDTLGTPAAVGGAGMAASGLGPHSAAELAAAVTRLEARVKAQPKDLDSRIMLGRALAALGRFDRAEDVLRHAVALAPDQPALHAELGEVMVMAAQGTVTAAAEAEFAKAPEDPRARFYEAEAAAQRGDVAGARRALQALLADAPADAPWRKFVEQGIAELSAAQPQQSAGAAEADSIPGPSAADIAAARAMTSDQRAAMIRGMVARLAARLEQHPDDREGWLRLAHAYDVIGEPDKAKAARARAAAAGAPAAASLTAASPAAAPSTAAPPAPAADPAAMVARLAARLERRPGDVAGWLMLARSYRVLGRDADALAALKRANRQVPGNLDLLKHYLAALAAGLADGQPSPELVAVAGRIHALDANQPDALWYLGLDAARRGDRFAAAKYWTRLAAELPQGSSERAVVQQKLDSLR
jgi:cytochrome c-type biogenesis protein CcmH